jgi:hypothetical protein
MSSDFQHKSFRPLSGGFAGEKRVLDGDIRLCLAFAPRRDVFGGQILKP